MEINTRLEDDVTIVDVLGSLDTRTSGTASEKLAKIAQTSSKLLLNLQDLEFISSAGLRIMLRLAKQLRESNGTLKVCGPKGIVLEIMDISGFDGLVDVYDSEQEALASF